MMSEKIRRPIARAEAGSSRLSKNLFPVRCGRGYG
jgi:hypothetical protein